MSPVTGWERPEHFSIKRKQILISKKIVCSDVLNFSSLYPGIPGYCVYYGQKFLPPDRNTGLKQWRSQRICDVRACTALARVHLPGGSGACPHSSRETSLGSLRGLFCILRRGDELNSMSSICIKLIQIFQIILLNRADIYSMSKNYTRNIPCGDQTL